MADVVPQPPPASNRGLWFLVVGLGVAILLVLAAMIGWAVNRARTDASPQAMASELNLDLAPDTAIAEARMDGTFLIVHITGPQGDEVLVIDPTKSKVISRVRFNKKS